MKRDPARAKQLADEGAAGGPAPRRRGNVGALMGLGDVDFDNGAEQKSVRFAELAVEAAPQSKACHLKLGAYYNVLRCRDAPGHYAQARDLGDAAAQGRIAKVRARIGDGRPAGSATRRADPRGVGRDADAACRPAGLRRRWGVPAVPYQHRGRVGAFATLSLGVIVLGAGLYAVGAGALVAAGAATLVGAVLVAAALFDLQRTPPLPRPLMTGEQVRALVAVQPLPFWVCTRCHALHEQNAFECLQCGRRVDYLEVGNERDRRTALAALSGS